MLVMLLWIVLRRHHLGRLVLHDRLLCGTHRLSLRQVRRLEVLANSRTRLTRLLKWRGDVGFPRLLPVIVHFLGSTSLLLVEYLAKFGGGRSLMHDLVHGSWLGAVLVRSTSHLLPGPWNVVVFTEPHVIGWSKCRNHWQRSHRTHMVRHTGLHKLRMPLSIKYGAGAGIVDNIWVVAEGSLFLLGLCGCFPRGFGATGSLLASQIFLSEALLPCLGLPIVITDAATIHNDAASKLTEHRFGGNDGDLPGPV